MSADQKRALYALLRKRKVDVFTHMPFERVSRSAPLPLSAAQRRLWLFWKLNPTSAAYHITGALRVRGELDIEATRRAFERLSLRHEALRTVFVEHHGEPRQHVQASLPPHFEVATLPAHATLAELARRAAEPFDLTRGPLLRVTVYQRDARESVFAITLHHIAADAWSLDVIVREFTSLYAAERTGTASALPELPVQYLDYSQWQETWLNAGENARQLAYFREQLADAEQGPLELPSDRGRPPVQSYRGDCVRGALDNELSARIKQLAQAHGATLHMLLLSLFGALLYRVTGRSDLLIGMPVANRARRETHGVVGFFVNTQVLRLRIDGRSSLHGLLEQVKCSMQGAQANAELPFDRLVDALKPERSLAYNPLFQVMFNHLRDAPGAATELAGLQIEPLTPPQPFTQFDLTLDTHEDVEGRVRLRFEYASDLFDPGTVERIAACYVALAQALAREPAVALREVGLATPPAAGEPAAGSFQALHAQIARRCAEQPSASAISCGGERIDFAQLERRVTHLAARLVAQGAGPERAVAVLCERTPDTLIALLAVLRAGAMFVPLDRTYPTARLSQMLALSAAQWLVTARHAAVPDELRAHVQLLAIDTPSETSLPELPATNVHPEQLAYVLFTSGSTGTPKPVGVSHAALARHATALARAYQLDARDRFLQFSSLSFDAALEQWLVPLASGACVVLRPDTLWSGSELLQAAAAQGITRLDLPPGYAAEVARAAQHAPALHALRSFTVGGEALPRETLAQLRRAFSGAQLYNAYGPTEAVITPLMWLADADVAEPYAPIGRPLAGRRAYVLDADLNLVPNGVIGELYVAGDALARGYLGRPRDTAAHFVPDPFGASGRMYRTGDLARVRGDGALQFVGRRDGQIKLRGHRIELGELESQLLALPGVHAALAIVASGATGSPQLLAYAVGVELDPSELQRALAAGLPGYMLPAQLIVLAELPRLPNGKVDVRALPAPSQPQPSGAVPEGQAEQLLAALFEAVLGIAAVDRTANFFALGGDSIMALQLSSRAREHGFELTPRQVFEHQTVRELAAALRPLQAAQSEASAEPVGTEIALTPIQRDFFRAELPDLHHYNQSVLLESDAPLDSERLARAISSLVAHHPALRLRFVPASDVAMGIQQHTAAHGGDELQQAHANDAGELTRLCEAAQRSLDLARGPLFRALHVSMADGSARLLLCAHHLVVDGVSFRILLADLARAYAGAAEQSGPQLPAAGASFAGWSQYLQRLAQSAALEPQRQYWQARVSEPGAQLPSGAHSPVRTARRAVTHLDRTATELLLRRAPEAYRTQGAELLLAALADVLCESTGQPATWIELESHGRDAPDCELDLNRSVGWFTALYPLRLSAPAGVGTRIKTVKEALRAAQQHAVSYGVLRELCGELGELRRPGLTFNYLGQFDGSLGDSQLRVAAESRGADQSPDGPLHNALEINGQIWNAELDLVWSADPQRYTQAELEALARAYERALHALIAHCSTGTRLGITPSDVPLAKLTQAQLDALPLSPAVVEDIYPLTPMQQGMLFQELHAPEQGIYVNQLAVRVEGLSPAHLARAWSALVARHAILRTVFVWQDLQEPLQVVLRHARSPLETRDLTHVPEAQLPDACAELLRAEHARGLPLDQAPLARFLVAELPDGAHQLIWTTHHLLLDGWSNARLLAELLEVYAATIEGGEQRATREPPPFRRYLQWLAERPPAESERFWRAQLRDASPSYLAGSLPQPAATTDDLQRGVVRHRLSAAAFKALSSFGLRERVTVGTLLEAAFGSVLAGYTGQRAVMFGVTVSGRPSSLPEAEQMLGLFINTIPSVQRISPRAPIGEHLRALQQRAAERREHEHTPLYHLARWAGQPGRPLFDCLLVFENYPVERALASAGGSLRFGASQGVEATEYALTLSANQSDGLSLAFEFARAHFDDAAVFELASRFEHALERLIDPASRTLSDVTLLRPSDHERLLVLQRSPARCVPHGFVHESFAARARLTPHATAVVCNGQRLTYAHLDERANQLAHALLRLGIGPDQRVGVALVRSVELIAAVLGVLKAGAAFVPLDPTYPAARLQLMATDAALSALVTESALTLQLDGLADCPRISIDDPALALEPRTAPSVPLHVEHLAYLIYTSGSTGRPKGVAVPHGALTMHLSAAAELYGLTGQDAALHLASISFDAAVEQWAVPLLSGAKLVLHADHEQAPEALYALAVREGVSLVYPPTSHLLGLARHHLELRPEERRLQLRLCTVGGEAVSRDTLDRLRSAFAPERVINGYGPTETVITPLLWQAFPDSRVESAYAPIGQLVGERTALILDAALEPVAPGLLGELYIAGAGLARGYHGAPRLTAERFLPAPHAPGERMYRTGDLVRLLPSGALEFVGRADAQIKLRGFRIEPAEIEAALLALEGVREAVVLLEEQPHRRLVAHVGHADPAYPATELLAQLRAALPPQLVPAFIGVMAELPRTPNGKVDRAQLPGTGATTRGYEPPRGAIEASLAELWAGLLGVVQVGRSDNFFELGGDSIISIQLISRARTRGLALTTRQVFEHPTLAALARVAKPWRPQQADAAERPEGAVPLTPIQRAFFARPMVAPHHFNQAVLLEPRMPLDRSALEAALRAVLSHHDALRLRYKQQGAVITQQYAQDASELGEVLWTRSAADGTALDALCQQAQRSFDLEHGPLLRALHVQLGDGSERLLLAVHHLVMDAVSFRILLEDLETCYRAQTAGHTLPQLQRTSSFQAYARSLTTYAQAAWLEHVPRWEALLDGAAVALPRDLPSGAPVGRAHVGLRLERAFTELLLRGVAHAYHTRIDDLLLAALARTLCAYAGTDSVSIELEGHGRQELPSALDVTRTVGWFTTSFPVRLSPRNALADSIKHVKEQLRASPLNGLSFGALRHLGPAEARERLAALACPEVSFNYLGQLDSSFDRERALFRLASESSGDDAEPSLPLLHPFSINAEVLDGQLQLSWAYSPALHRRETVQRLVRTFQAELGALVEHCRSQQRSSWTPSDVPLAGLDQAALDALAREHAAASDVYRLTPLQHGMLYHALAEPDADVYVTQLAVDIEGLDATQLARFRAAWQATVDAHDSLRTCFVAHPLPHPVQLVHAQVELPFVVTEPEVPPSAAELEALAEAERQRGFALDQAPLMRVALVRTSATQHRLIWTSHHLLLDGWSSSLLFGEVLARFHAAEVAAPTLRFREYVSWLQDQDRAAAERFFRGQLSALQAPTFLGRSRRAGLTRYASERLRLPETHSRALERLAASCSVTMSTLVQAAWAVLLQRVSGHTCVAFGATVSGRPAMLPDVERVLGLFINTLPVICAPGAHLRVRDWLAALQAQQLELREHESTPLYDVQSWAGFGGALFDTLIVFENYPVAKALQEQCGTLKFAAAASHETTNYPLTLGVSYGTTLECSFDYQLNAFEPTMIRQLAKGLGTLLGQLAANPEQRLGSLQPWAADVGEPSSAALAQPAVSCDLFAQVALHAQRAPERLAVSGAAHSLSYGELTQLAERVAARLLTAGVGPESIVGVRLPRSPEAVVVLLGVLAARAAFVVFDPAQPSALLRRQAELARPSVLIVAGEDTLADSPGVPLLQLPALLKATDESPFERPDALSGALAYVLYTSGSTGVAKGVEVTLGALAQQCQAMAQLADFAPGDRALLFASLSFDAALEQWLVPLTRGASVHVMEGVWSPAQMVQEIAQHALTHVDLPPAYARLVARECERRGVQLRLKTLVVGGEALPAATLEVLDRAVAGAALINAYGPTEAVITPTAWIARTSHERNAPTSHYAPIGQPLAARRAYVLDACLSPLPEGIVGELYLGGLPLARGYRERPAATAERFIPDPFSPSTRMLRTGDRVRRLPDGQLEFVGRSDQQLKIRGFRVELGEIEATLLRYPDVRDAVVLPQEHAGELSLTAYVASEQADSISLLAYLSRELPAHAVPRSLYCLPNLPRNANGKLDARALPAPEARTRLHVMPRTPTEQLVAAAFAAVLAQPAEIHVQDNFFELGGHSLRALELVSELQRRTGGVIRLVDVVSHPTVEALAAHLESTKTTQATPLAQSPLIALNRGLSTRPALYCMHPAGGTPFSYLPLARALASSDGRAVYGLVCRSLFDPEHRDASMEALAQDYAAEIRKAQPHGPYHLLGWSLGGLIALHVAAALEAQGQQVRSLSLVDSFVPGLTRETYAEPAVTSDVDVDAQRLIAAFDSRDRTAGAATLAHLQLLSRRCQLPRLQVRYTCFWSHEERALHAPAEALLERGTNQPLATRTEIPVSHLEIVRDARLFEALALSLAAADSRS